MAEARVHLFQRTAKLDVVLLGRRLVLLDRRQGFPQVQQRGLNDGFRLLEPGDFLSRVDAVFLEVVDVLLEGGHLLFEVAGRGFGSPLALDATPNRLTQPIALALSRFSDRRNRVSIQAKIDVLGEFRFDVFHSNLLKSFI
ncbi:MAG: hypothetical protein V9G18_00315 [Albidovulum sp.]